MAVVRILEGIKVVDLGLGMAASLAAKFLVELGAEVTRIEPEGGDPFGRIYPAQDVWQRGKALAPAAQLESLLANADICLMGGEDWPGVPRRADARALSDKYARLVVLNLEGDPPGTASAGRPATEVLIQARSGLAYEHYKARANLMSFSPAAYGAAMRGLTGLFAAMYEREGSGKGQVVATSLLEGALSWAGSIWLAAEKPTPNAMFVMPKDPWPLIFRCADGVYIHLAIGPPGTKYKLYQALEVDDPTVVPDSPSMPKPTDDPKNFFGDWDVMAEHVAKKSSKEMLQRIWDQGLPAEPVLAPGACWDEPQVVFNKIITTEPDGVRHVGHPIGYASNAAPYKGPPKTGALPLSGVRVVDFGAFVAGPFASVVLADLGAEVIKVETPALDPNRSIFRSYSAANRGKLAITLDLKDKGDLQTAKDICAASQIVTSNFRGGVSTRLGIDPDQLHAVKPELVVVEAPAYGAAGPLVDRAGFDMVMQALCGHEYRAGGEGNEPLWNRTSQVDYTGGFLGAVGATAGLYHQARTGQGVTVESTLMNAGIYITSEVIQTAKGVFAGGETMNAQRTGFRASEALYEAADGWVALCVRSAEQAKAAGEVLGIGLPADPQAWGAAEGEAIAAAIKPHAYAGLLAKLEAAGVWVEYCRKDAEKAILTDPAMFAANVVQVSAQPDMGQIREIGAMLRFSRSKAGHDRYAPLPNENAEQILKATGLEDRIKTPA